MKNESCLDQIIESDFQLKEANRNYNGRVN